MNLFRCITSLAFACGLMSATTASADGFFRRLPEVGESVTYETVLAVTFGNESITIPEYSGTLTVQCVDQTTIEEVDYYWIEVLLALESHEQPLEMTWKLLIAESDLVDGDPIANFSRGWQSSGVGTEPVELTADMLNDSTSPAPLFLRAVFWSPEGEPETLDQAQTVTLGDNEVRIEAAEHGDFATDELSGASDVAAPLAGWGTWWLHEEAAFGVAQAEQLWTISNSEAGEVEFALQYTLKEAGSDAVSALPDHE